MYEIALVYFNETHIGYLERKNQQYIFRYDKSFLDSSNRFPLAYNFPLEAREFRSEKMFPFFQGLVAEGWLLKVQSKNQKIDEKDYFSILLENGEDMIGGVKIRKVEKNK